MALVRERTIPTERQPLVGEVRANFCGQRVPGDQCDGIFRVRVRVQNFTQQDGLLIFTSFCLESCMIAISRWIRQLVYIKVCANLEKV
jgi:hypothetical protein